MNLETLHVGKFRNGINYRPLSPIREGGRKWRYISICRNFLPVERLVTAGRVISFRDKDEREWMRFTDKGAESAAWYAWNGCTPKFYFLRRWWGTPDFAATIQASMWHDAFYQFSCCHDFPLHRSECDAIFRRIIEHNGSPRIAALYHHYVRKYGRWDGDPTHHGEHSVILHP
jgi:sarcosine oxidase delta subunit